MSLFTINSQEKFNETLLWISDLSKDAYGYRVRMDYGSMSWDELAQWVNYFYEEIRREMEAAEEFDSRMAEEYELGIQRCLEAGASDRETAARWLEESDEVLYFKGECYVGSLG
jgi:hypothetical protein